MITLAGTAGTWFLLDYAYYGNTISTPQILGLISPHASTTTKIALQLAIFVVAAVPGYVLAIARLDRIGHRRLQLTGFAMMALCFATIAIVPGLTTLVVPFLLFLTAILLSKGIMLGWILPPAAAGMLALSVWVFSTAAKGWPVR